jgi:hypothetical protein
MHSNDFLKELYSIENFRKALDFLFKTVNKLQWDNDFTTVENILEDMDMSKVSDEVLIGTLTITRPSRYQHVQAYKDFYNGVNDMLKNNPDKEQILRGLEF